MRLRNRFSLVPSLAEERIGVEGLMSPSLELDLNLVQGATVGAEPLGHGMDRRLALGESGSGTALGAVTRNPLSCRGDDFPGMDMVGHEFLLSGPR